VSNRADLVITGARVYRGAGDASRSPVTGSWASAVALSGDRIVAVGDRGAPDAYQATAWLSPTGVGR